MHTHGRDFFPEASEVAVATMIWLVILFFVALILGRLFLVPLA